MKTTFLSALLLLACAVTPLQAAQPIMDRETAKEAIQHTDYGLRFLRSHQAPDGSWSDSVALTAVALHAFVHSHRHYTEDDGPFITRPVAYLVSHARDDGSIGNASENIVEQTALALIALQSLKNPAHDQVIRRAQHYLKAQQHKGSGGVANPEDAHPNLLTQALVMEAMHKSGLDSADPFWQKSLAFVAQAQDSQGQYPAQLAALRCLLDAGLDKNDPRVAAAWRRVSQQYSLQQAETTNGADAWFDGLNNFSKAVRGYRTASVTDAAGGSHTWRNDIARTLLDRYRGDGSWVDAQGSDSDPLRTTAWSVSTLNQVVRSLRDR